MATATVHKLKIPARLECIECNATGEAPCDCGAGFRAIPPSIAAARAVAANPGKSDRAIAAEVGVSDKTVAKARRSTAETSAVAPATRVGRDGKTRKVPPLKFHQYTEADTDEDRDLNYIEDVNAVIRRRVFDQCVSRSVTKAKQGAGLRDARPEDITPEVLDAMDEVIAAWAELRNEKFRLADTETARILQEIEERGDLVQVELDFDQRVRLAALNANCNADRTKAELKKSRGKVTRDALKGAREAAKSWADIAGELERRSKSQIARLKASS